jgi:hypothetical protein
MNKLKYLKFCLLILISFISFNHSLFSLESAFLTVSCPPDYDRYTWMNGTGYYEPEINQYWGSVQYKHTTINGRETVIVDWGSL